MIRDIGALYTRLAPGFVTDTRLEPGMRIVTFANGMVVQEPILSIDEEHRRVAWTAKGGLTTHYNSSMQVFAEGETGSRLVCKVHTGSLSFVVKFSIAGRQRKQSLDKLVITGAVQAKADAAEQARVADTLGPRIAAYLKARKKEKDLRAAQPDRGEAASGEASSAPA